MASQTRKRTKSKTRELDRQYVLAKIARLVAEPQAWLDVRDAIVANSLLLRRLKAIGLPPGAPRKTERALESYIAKVDDGFAVLASVMGLWIDRVPIAASPAEKTRLPTVNARFLVERAEEIGAWDVWNGEAPTDHELAAILRICGRLEGETFLVAQVRSARERRRARDEAEHKAERLAQAKIAKFVRGKPRM